MEQTPALGAPDGVGTQTLSAVVDGREYIGLVNLTQKQWRKLLSVIGHLNDSLDDYDVRERRDATCSTSFRRTISPLSSGTRTGASSRDRCT